MTQQSPTSAARREPADSRQAMSKAQRARNARLRDVAQRRIKALKGFQSARHSRAVRDEMVKDAKAKVAARRYYGPQGEPRP